MEDVRLDGVSDEGVLERVEVLVGRSNETTAELLAYLAEVDSRGLHLGQACGSLFAYCVERLHMSEAAAGKRITAARAARRFPVLLGMIARGEIHLCGVSLLAAHLTEENHAELLARARHLSKRAIEKLVAEIAPRPDVRSRVVALPSGAAAPAGEPVRSTGQLDSAQEVHAPGRAGEQASPAVVAPLAPRRYQIRLTVDEETHAALCQLQDLLSHRIPNRDPAAIISRALAHELERTLARKTGATERPRAQKVARRRNRHIPAAVRREVWQRDGGQCAFVDDQGRRCSSRRFIELHHLENWGRGAEHDPDEIELRCRAHNQYQADIDYGAAFMAARKRAARSRAREVRTAYGSAGEMAAGGWQGGVQAGAARRVALGTPSGDGTGTGTAQPREQRQLATTVGAPAVAFAAALATEHWRAGRADLAGKRRLWRFALPRPRVPTAVDPAAADFGCQGEAETGEKRNCDRDTALRVAPVGVAAVAAVVDLVRNPRGIPEEGGGRCGVARRQPVGVGAGERRVGLDDRRSWDHEQVAGRQDEGRSQRAPDAAHPIDGSGRGRERGGRG